MAINVHGHIWTGQDVEQRVEHYRHPEVTHTVLFGDDELVAEAQRRHPDFAIGFGTVSRGVSATPETIRRIVDRGLGGVKIIGIGRPYDDPGLFDMYEAIAEQGLPILFHTGYLALPREPVHDSFLFMRPGRLDTLARRFPSLVMIGAHLGQAWCEEACSVMGYHANVYFEMSGGTVKKKPLAWFQRLFPRPPAGASFGPARPS